MENEPKIKTFYVEIQFVNPEAPPRATILPSRDFERLEPQEVLEILRVASSVGRILEANGVQVTY